MDQKLRMNKMEIFKRWMLSNNKQNMILMSLQMKAPSLKFKVLSKINQKDKILLLSILLVFYLFLFSLAAWQFHWLQYCNKN